MPSWAPRSDTTKKREQLLKREEELKHAVRAGLPHAKVLKAAQRVREAQLSLLKARLHWARDAQIQKSGQGVTRAYGEVEEIEDAIRDWKQKSTEAIVSEHERDLTNR
jgi:hypothetical protein